jgi:hypothetical protein
MAISTTALESIERGQLLTQSQCDFANGWLIAKGINPLLAFRDAEVNQYHRFIALSREELIAGVQLPDQHTLPPDKTLTEKWGEVIDNIRMKRSETEGK